MISQQDEIEQVARIISQEIPRLAKLTATRLFPNKPPGSEKLSKPDYFAFLDRHWQEPGFQQRTLRAMGYKNFKAMYHEYTGLDLEDEIKKFSEGKKMAEQMMAQQGSPPVPMNSPAMEAPPVAQPPMLAAGTDEMGQQLMEPQGDMSGVIPGSV